MEPCIANAPQATVGKPVGSDLRQGLVTLPALNYFTSYPDDPDLDWIISEAFSSDERIERLVGAIRTSGAIEESLEEARRFVDCGLEILHKQPDSDERRALEDLANYIVRRTL